MAQTQKCPGCGDTIQPTKTKWGIKHECRKCKLHGWKGKPMVSRETHRARKLARTAFDPLWRTGMMSRGQAYELLAEGLGIDRKECHMAAMDYKTARRVPGIIGEIRKRLRLDDQKYRLELMRIILSQDKLCSADIVQLMDALVKLEGDMGEGFVDNPLKPTLVARLAALGWRVDNITSVENPRVNRITGSRLYEVTGPPEQRVNVKLAVFQRHDVNQSLELLRRDLLSVLTAEMLRDAVNSLPQNWTGVDAAGPAPADIVAAVQAGDLSSLFGNEES